MSATLQSLRTSILLIIFFAAYSGFGSKLVVCTFYNKVRLSYSKVSELPGSLLVSVMIFYGILLKDADRVNVESNTFLSFCRNKLNFE